MPDHFPSQEIEDAFQKHGLLFPSVIDLESYFGADPQEHPLRADLDNFDSWLKKNYHGEMKFLEKNAHVREDPRHILPEAKTAITFIVPYAVGESIRKKYRDWKEPGGITPLVARYARGKDYHKVIKKKVDKVMKDLFSDKKTTVAHRAVVDSMPFLDRANARKAGLGFVGKNTMLIRPGVGSFFFVGTVLLNTPSGALTDCTRQAAPEMSLTCGSCTRCLDACPTNAIVAPYQVDSRKCLSYWSIEARGEIPEEYRAHFQKTIYGCDICQEVCPYNLKTLDLVAVAEFYDVNKALQTLTVEQVAQMNQAEYERWFGGTAMTRAKKEGLKRNAAYHIQSRDTGKD